MQAITNMNSIQRPVNWSDVIPELCATERAAEGGPTQEPFGDPRGYGVEMSLPKFVSDPKGGHPNGYQQKAA
jgi:hypothetical protein